MLREAESVIKKEKSVLYISETKKKRKANKTQKKGKGKERSRRVKVTKKDPTKDKRLYFHYGKDKHWKKNSSRMRLVRGEMDLEMGNEARVITVVVGQVSLHLLGGATIA
ncbi:hypothetical protein GW17_00017515 [Ensete ventricosum]|nr:hypothetical protein GW17_00017515 [Ensete ventricosum]RZR99598.1 hypothetical protein BHM03_00029170 [Ensete ventricosum]